MMTDQFKNEPIDHHFVPQTYLRHFENSNQKLYRCRIWDDVRNSIKETSSAGIAYRKHFYRLLNVSTPGLTPLVIESHLNRQYEAVIPAFWDFFALSQSRISLNMKYEMSEVITNFKMRNPYIRGKFFENKELLIQQIQDSLVTFIADLERSELTEQQLKRETANLKKLEGVFLEQIRLLPASELHNRFLIYQDAENSQIKRSVIWQLAQGDWEILECEMPGFITTDNPGIAMKGNNSFNLGHPDGKFEYYFPLSSLQVLKIHCNNRPQSLSTLRHVSYRSVQIGEVEQVNCFVCLNAVEDIYGHDKLHLVRTKELMAMNK